MLYETRRILLGFRLKLTFDESFNKKTSCIFVDVSKTATVGLLLNNIIERFQIPHNSFLTVQNCEILPSESIHVLLDVNSVKINDPFVSTTEIIRTQSSAVSQDENAAQGTNEVVPCNESDVTDGKSNIFPKPRPPKRPIREGIAATIKMLLHEKEMDEIGQECSGLNLSNDASKIQSPGHQETMNVDDDKADSSLHAEDLSDVTSDACSNFNIEKKKRKRKRKHAKNHEVHDQPSISTEPILELRKNSNKAHPKHIRFDDADDEGLDTSVDKQVVSNMDKPPANSQIHQQPPPQESSLLSQLQQPSKLQLQQPPQQQQQPLQQHQPQPSQLPQQQQQPLLQPESVYLLNRLRQYQNLQILGQHNTQQSVQHQLQFQELTEKHQGQLLLQHRIMQQIRQQQLLQQQLQQQQQVRLRQQYQQKLITPSLHVSGLMPPSLVNLNISSTLTLKSKSVLTADNAGWKFFVPGIIERYKMMSHHRLATNTATSQTGMQSSSEQGQSGFSGGEIKIPDITKNLSNGQLEDKETSDQSNVMETANLSRVEIPSCSNDQGSQKLTNKQGQQSHWTANATSAKTKNNYNREESYHRPKSSLSPYNGRISNNKNTWNFNPQTDSNSPTSAFINLPRLSKTENVGYKPESERVEKELATLLMCKQLDTCMQYQVQFANEEGDGASSHSPSSLKGVKNVKLAASQLNRCTKKPNASNPAALNVKTEGNYERDSPERMEAASDDCEFLKQVKLDGQKIRLRKPDGTWTILTPDIAIAELPKLDVPKENQSIVFQIIYLNKSFIPTPSELLYGQIVSYNANTNTLALDIPHQFLQAMAKDCQDEVLPETIIPITGSTFEVDFSNLIEPRVIS